MKVKVEVAFRNLSFVSEASGVGVLSIDSDVKMSCEQNCKRSDDFSQLCHDMRVMIMKGMAETMNHDVLKTEERKKNEDKIRNNKDTPNEAL